MKKEEAKLGKPPTGVDDDIRKARKGSLAVTLADRVMARRKVMDLTQAEVAEKAGIGLKTFRRMEKASCDQLLSALDGVADALDVPAWQLLK